MNILVSLLIMSVLLLTAKAFPANLVPIQPGDDNTDITRTTTAPNPEQPFSLSRYTTMVHNLVGAMQTIWILLKEHVNLL